MPRAIFKAFGFNIARTLYFLPFCFVFIAARIACGTIAAIAVVTIIFALDYTIDKVYYGGNEPHAYYSN